MDPWINCTGGEYVEAYKMPLHTHKKTQCRRKVSRLSVYMYVEEGRRFLLDWTG